MKIDDRESRSLGGYLGIGQTDKPKIQKNIQRTEPLRSTPFQDLAKMADEVDRHR